MHLGFGDALKVVFELACIADLAPALHLGASGLGTEVVVVIDFRFTRPEEAEESTEGAFEFLLSH